MADASVLGKHVHCPIICAFVSLTLEDELEEITSPSITSTLTQPPTHHKPAGQDVDARIACGGLTPAIDSSCSSFDTIWNLGSGITPLPASNSNPPPPQRDFPRGLETSNLEPETPIVARSLQSSSGPATQESSSDFREPKLIPGTTPPISVYPHSTGQITDSFHQRFREVINMFRENTERHQDLGPFVHHIDYTLRLCGPSPTTAHPSILVFCRRQEFRSLRTLLTSKELGTQYLLRKPSRAAELFGRLRSATVLATEHAGAPLFNLYFWRGVRPRTLLAGEDAKLVVNSQISSMLLPATPTLYSLCGAVIQPLDGHLGSSTFSCAILVDGQLYGITTRHDMTVNGNASTAQGPIAGELRPATSPRLPHAEPLSDTCNDFVIDDVEYEDLSDDEGEESTKLSVGPPRYSPRESQTENPDHGVAELPVRFLTHYDDIHPSAEQDSDWAIFPLSGLEGYMRLGKRLVNHPRLESRGILRHYAKASPICDRRVFLITRDKTPEFGTLRRGTSILGGINGNKPSPAWTVALDGGRGEQPLSQGLPVDLTRKVVLRMGDSGSLVVDAFSDIIYGLVIGSNPIGEIYISPFVEIMNQIQQYFPYSSIALPEPEPSAIGTPSRVQYSRSRFEPTRLPFVPDHLDTFTGQHLNPAQPWPMDIDSRAADHDGSYYQPPPLSHPRDGSSITTIPSRGSDEQLEFSVSGGHGAVQITHGPTSVDRNRGRKGRNRSRERKPRSEGKKGGRDTSRALGCIYCRLKGHACNLGDDGDDECFRCRLWGAPNCVPLQFFDLTKEGSMVFTARQLAGSPLDGSHSIRDAMQSSTISSTTKIRLVHDGVHLYEVNLATSKLVNDVKDLDLQNLAGIESFIESRKRHSDWKAALVPASDVPPSGRYTKTRAFDLLVQFAGAIKQPVYMYMNSGCEGEQPQLAPVPEGSIDCFIAHALSLVFGRQIEHEAWRKFQKKAEKVRSWTDDEQLDELEQHLKFVRKLLIESNIRSLLLFFGPILLPKAISWYRSVRDASRDANLPLRPVPPNARLAVTLLAVLAAAYLVKALPVFSPENLFVATQSRLQIPVDVLFARVAAALRRPSSALTNSDDALRARFVNLESRLLYLQFGPDVLAECPFCTADEPKSYFYYALPALIAPHLANLVALAVVTSPSWTGKPGAQWRRLAVIAAAVLAGLDVYSVSSYNYQANARALRLADIDFFFWRARALRLVALAGLDALPSAAERVDAAARAVAGAKSRMSAAYWTHEVRLMRDVMEERDVIEGVNDALANRIDIQAISRDADMYAHGVLEQLRQDSADGTI
ncbi:chorismate synthase protein [Purpureocillium lavendulum]|uniref:Chorismate synthase protein n=1 Tax=Purpureocillium lavendulum TaxID=1247861 RepID=A0AB34FMN3_9HYPO|nr:chorismate synthase protein [Purpureocillium lavendulum]